MGIFDHVKRVAQNNGTVSTHGMHAETKKRVDTIVNTTKGRK